MRVFSQVTRVDTASASEKRVLAGSWRGIGGQRGCARTTRWREVGSPPRRLPHIHAAMTVNY